MRARPWGAIAGISVGLVLSGCLDNNPKFVEPPVPTSGASDSASSTGDPATGTWTTDAPATGTTTGTAMTGSDSGTTVNVTSTTDPITTGMTTGPQPVCGDGKVEGGEECDNGIGNADDADCTSACKDWVCGDGLINISSEECDDLNADPGDGCVDCVVPRTCLELLSLAPMAPTDQYFIDVDGPGPEPAIPVGCDMVTAGGGWTIVERSPSDTPIGVALYKDSPVNMGDPMALPFRLPKLFMSALMGKSSEAWLDCGGDDHLLFSPFDLFKGEMAPPDCSNVDKVLYKEAQLKGFLLKDVELCTGFTGLNDGQCQGAWRIDESEQTELCGLMDYPWDFMVPVTTPGADAFAVDAQVDDITQPPHDCHGPGAVRVIMLR